MDVWSLFEGPVSFLIVPHAAAGAPMSQQKTAKLTRPAPRWHAITAECLVTNDGKYGIAQLMGAWYAYRRRPLGGVVQLGEALDSREAAEAQVEAHRWGHAEDEPTPSSGTVASGLIRGGA
jgi:hypothetical protein